jgi:hypothetical protein
MLIYHSADPEANRDQHTEFETVDFLINASSDRNLVAGSVRIEGTLGVFSDAAGNTRITATDDETSSGVHLNRRIGAHALVESISTTLGTGQVIENISQDYGRYVNMVQSATKSNDSYYDSLELCELKAPNNTVAESYAAGLNVPHSGGEGVYIDMDFSFKPFIALNRSTDDIQMSKVGNNIRLSLNLARNANALQGRAQDGNTQYIIKELRCTFRTEDARPTNPIMDSVVPVKHVINSSFSNVSGKVPARVHSVSGSFMKFSKENQVKTDNHALEVPPNLQEIQFMFNNSSNQLTQYILKDYGMWLDGYLASLKSSGIAEVSPNNIRNQTFGIGLDFNDTVDLTNEKFSVQVKSDVASGHEYLLYLYFNSRISL